MPLELRLTLAFLVAAAVAWAATPVLIRVALATGFLDRPLGYKGHERATPYLGGTAIFAGILVAALTFGGGAHGVRVAIACAAALWVVGTLDDRVNLSPFLRLALEAAVATVLSLSGHGWEIFGSDAVNVVVTCVWVVAVVNALNLMDNMDGAAATVGALSAAGAGVLAALAPDPLLAALCFAITGACVGFLPHNLARPSRVFMGDGGSLPLGLLLAAVAPAAAAHWDADVNGLATGALLVGLVVLDTSLVTFSRRRAGRPLLTGGRDHLTHRLATLLGSKRAVIVVLAAAQLLVCAAAVVLAVKAPGAEFAFALFGAAAGAWAIVLLDRPGWQTRHVAPLEAPELASPAYQSSSPSSSASP